MLYFPDSDSLPQKINALTALPLVLTIGFYTLYWLVASSRRLKEMVYARYESINANIIHVAVKRTAGFFLLGVLPVSLTVLLSDGYTLADAGLVYRPDATRFSLISVILISLLIIPIVSFGARKPAVYGTYPEIRVTSWTGRFLLAELFTWALYLLGYEALFRGVLLFGLVRSFGPVAATLISVILYSAAHLPKNRAETLAAIPFGLVLCVLTLYSGSIWIAFFAHTLNAFTTTVTAIKYNPVMNFSYQEKGIQQTDGGN